MARWGSPTAGSDRRTSTSTKRPSASRSFTPTRRCTRGRANPKRLFPHVDFLPTIASLFGAPAAARANWQGVDYSSLVLNPSAPPVQDYTVFTYDDYQSGQK